MNGCQHCKRNFLLLTLIIWPNLCWPTAEIAYSRSHVGPLNGPILCKLATAQTQYTDVVHIFAVIIIIIMCVCVRKICELHSSRLWYRCDRQFMNVMKMISIAFKIANDLCRLMRERGKHHCPLNLAVSHTKNTKKLEVFLFFF